MCVRRYRDAGMTGWGVLVLYLLSIACSYTQVSLLCQLLNMTFKQIL